MTAPKDNARLLEELQTHQVELEMQNEELRRIQAELEDSRARYFDLYDLAPVGYLTLDKKGLILEGNITAAGLLRAERGSLAKQPLSRFVFTEDQAIFYRHQTSHPETGLPRQCELRLLRAGSGPFWARLDCVGAKTSDGAPVTRVTLSDITEARESLARLALSEARFRTLFDSASDALMTLEPPSWRFTSCNPATLKMFGAPDVPSFTALGPWDVSPQRQPDGRASWEKAGEYIELALKSGHLSFEWAHRRLDGQDFPATVLLSRVERDGRTFLQATIRDISEQKRADAALLRLKAAIEQVSDAIIISDPAGTIQFVNPAFEAATGYTDREVLGQNPRMLKSGRHDAAFYRALWDKISSGRPWTGSMVNRRKDGSLYTAETVISAVRDASGRIVNYVAVKRDITERLELESQLRQAQKMEVVGRLAGGVAHDFNNLLTSILGNCGFLLNDIPEGDPKRADVLEIRDAGLRAAGLTRQLLAFSRKQIMTPKPIDLNLLLKELMSFLRRLIGENIEAAFTPEKDLPLVLCDPGQFEQVVMNLVVNARDAMPRGGKLSLRTSTEELAEGSAGAGGTRIPAGRYACVTISDSGSGMDEDTVKRIFEPFFTTKEPDKGTGLGLSTAFGIIDQSGGFFTVTSSPGKGTTFKIFLPTALSVKTEETSEPPRTARQSAKRAVVLLAEDESSVRRLAARILKAAGYEVLEASSGRDALAKADRPFDLLLTDIALGDMSGLALARELERVRPHLKVVFMSGYTDSPEIRDILSKPENRFLQKPFTPDVLAEMVRGSLA